MRESSVRTHTSIGVGRSRTFIFLAQLDRRREEEEGGDRAARQAVAQWCEDQPAWEGRDAEQAGGRRGKAGAQALVAEVGHEVNENGAAAEQVATECQRQPAKGRAA